MTKRSAEQAIADDLKAADAEVTRLEAKYAEASEKVKAALNARAAIDEARQRALARRQQLDQAAHALGHQVSLDEAIVETAAAAVDAPVEIGSKRRGKAEAAPAPDA